MGGVGKTRLAAAVAATFEAEGGQVVWLDSQELTPAREGDVERSAPVVAEALVAEALVAALGMEVQPNLAPAQRLVAEFRGRDTLLVLDGIDRVLDECR